MSEEQTKRHNSDWEENSMTRDLPELGPTMRYLFEHKADYGVVRPKRDQIEPEIRLLQALLEDAIAAVGDVRSKQKKKRIEALYAIEWVNGIDQAKEGLSFDVVCEGIGISSSWARQVILSTKRRITSHTDLV